MLFEKDKAMSDIDKVVHCSHQLELLLKEQYHATGQGLSQLIESVESRLPHDLISQLHYIAKIYQRVLEEPNFRFEGKRLEGQRRFMEAYKQCKRELTPRGNRFIWRLTLSLLTFMTAAALVFYYAIWDSLQGGISL